MFFYIHLNLYRISMRVVFSYHSLQIFIYYNYTINIQNYKPLLSSGRQEAGCVGHLAVCLTAPISKFLGNVQHMVHTPHSTLPLRARQATDFQTMGNL